MSSGYPDGCGLFFCIAMNKAYYAIIPAKIRYDKSLPPNAKLLYGEITALANEKGYCYAKNSYFAELYDVAPETVSRWIKKLKDKAFIKTQCIYKDGTNQIIERRIYINDCSYPIDKNVNTPRQKCQDPIDENVKTPIDENVKDNNTSINNTINNTGNSKIELSEHELRDKIGKKTYLIFNDYLRQNLNLSEPKINLLLDWFDYRKENGKPVNCKYSMLEIYEKFQKISYVVLKEAFAKSVSAGYPDLYTDKINPKPNQSPEPTKREKGKIKYYDFRETMELRGVKDESKIKEMYAKYEAGISQKTN